MKVVALSIDSSTLSDYRTCPTYFSLRHVQGLDSPTKSDALSFGDLVHKGLERLYQGSGLAATLEALKSEAPESILTAQPLARRSFEHLSKLLTAYVGHYFPDTQAPDKFEHHAQSYLGEVEYVDRSIPITYSGTLDGLNTKTNTVFETKTTSYLDSRFLDRTTLNHQATGYVFLAQSLGYPVEGVLFNAISTGGYGSSAQAPRPQSWPLHKDPSKLFLRAHTYRSAEHLAQWKAEVLATCADIIRDVERDFYTSNKPDACTRFNSRCSMYDICSASASVRPAIIKNAYTVAPWRGLKLTLSE